MSGTIPWRDIETLFRSLGAVFEERAGSRVAIVLFGDVRVFHRPHPSPETEKAAVVAVVAARKWLELNGVEP
ncbi:MAG: type II toxin-antitoxin system HicA family toxin [Janthinobacterium lividum]